MYFLCEASVQWESPLAERSCHSRNKWSLQLSCLELLASQIVYVHVLVSTLSASKATRPPKHL